MKIERIATSLLLAAGLFAAIAARAQQEPPPFPGGAEAQAPDETSQGAVTDANTNDPAAAASADYFHEQLAPYGQWVSHEGSGEVWVPKVEPGWRPYTAGHWAYTDQGWAWVADEPWGWAAFHYGRWDYDQEMGWAWTPGNVWAPAWVAWRSGGGYLGWAPLSSTVGFNAEEGLEAGAAASITAGYFTFVAEQNILRPNIAAVIVPSTRNVTIVSNTTNITRYAVSNHRVFNAGVDVHHIEKVTGRPVPQVRVATMAQAGAHGRGAFYQPAVVSRAADRTRAEFGPALKSRQGGQPANRAPRPDSAGSSRTGTIRTLTDRPGTGPSRTPRYSTSSPTMRQPPIATPRESREQHFSPGQTHATPPQRSTSPQPSPQNRPAVPPAQPKSQEKPQPQKSETKSKHKPPL